jgi:hypothetical protein
MRGQVTRLAMAMLAGFSLTCGTGCFCDFLSYHEDVDIRTGRVKTTNYLLFLPVCIRTYDTVITRSLPEEKVRGVEADWQKVNTFYWLLQVSPHYPYHGTTSELRNLEQATKTIDFTPEALREVAMRTTKLWQSNPGDGNWYLYQVNEAATQAHSDGKTVFHVSDLPETTTAGSSP